MHDKSAAKNALGTDQFDEIIGNGALGVALAVGFEVSEVADMAFGVRGGAVFFGEGVDCEREGIVNLGIIESEGGEIAMACHSGAGFAD